MPTNSRYTVITDIPSLISLLPDINDLGDSEKLALGFLAGKAYQDAVYRKRIIALVDRIENKNRLAGYILYGGVYPYAKIQHIATVKAYRRQGVGSILINEFVEYLEKLCFIELQADIAEDLEEATAFYQKNGFRPIRSRRGGKSRNRRIIPHVRELRTETLFSNLSQKKLNPSIRGRFRLNLPIFALDLNVVFDLVRERNNSGNARLLFSAALKHSVRLAVSDEVISELKRNSKTISDDTMLHLALTLPQLAKVSSIERDRLRDEIHKTVFVDRKSKTAYSPQSLSDASHLAHARLAGALAFVTHDMELLRARDTLFNNFDIDIVSVEDLIQILPQEQARITNKTTHGDGFTFTNATKIEILKYFTENNLPTALEHEFNNPMDNQNGSWLCCIRAHNEIVGIAILLFPRAAGQVSKLLIHFEEDNLNSVLFGDHMIDLSLRLASEKSVVSIDLEYIEGQRTLEKLALAKGFKKQNGRSSFQKIVIGRPVSSKQWSNLVLQMQLQTGIKLPEKLPKKHNDIKIVDHNNENFTLSRDEFEELFAPTIIAWNDRDGVVLPIKPNYSNELFGADLQYSLFAGKEALFHSRRGYVRSTSHSSIMKPGSPIFFYESKDGNKGKGAVHVIARIINAVIYPKLNVTSEMKRLLVVENFHNFSKTENVMLISFDSIFKLPSPISLVQLKKLKVADGSNMVAPRSISGKQANNIIDKGFYCD